MITTRYCSPNSSDDDFGQSELRRLGLSQAFGSILVVELPDLRPATLAAAIEHLIDSPGLTALESDPHRIGGGRNPVVFEAAGMTLSERAFWTLVCDTNTEALKLVQRYVQMVVSHGTPFADSCHDRSSSAVGEDALFALIDTRFIAPKALHESPSDADLAALVQLFVGYVTQCDPGHQYRPEPYVRRILELAKHSDVGAHNVARLVAYYGSYGDGDLLVTPTGRWALATNGVLKLVLDEDLARLTNSSSPLNINHPDRSTSDVDYIGWLALRHIDAVYGRNPARDLVHNYVAETASIDLDDVTRTDEAWLDWADTQPLYGPLNTGFHQVVDRAWTPLPGA